MKFEQREESGEMRVRRKKMHARKMLGIARHTVFSDVLWLRQVRLAKAAGAKVYGRVVISRFRSQKSQKLMVPQHFCNLNFGKVSNASCFNDLEVKSVKNCQVRSAFASWTSESVTTPRVLMIWKSKVWKTVSSAPLLSVQLRKSVKTPRALTISKSKV